MSESEVSTERCMRQAVVLRDLARRESRAGNRDGAISLQCIGDLLAEPAEYGGVLVIRRDGAP
ncbi:MAG TPA: hypothetical protein VHS58_02380 [Acetobacteraceae bacterium]|nr:hypothetical protein [Acetobacteraceae bacterium]